MDELARVLAQTAADSAGRLRNNGIVPDGLAEFVPARRVMLVQRAATMRPLGEAWRVGTLLLAASPDLAAPIYVAGPATRAAKRLHPGNQSVSREERRDIAASALTGGYAEGRTVNYDAHPVPSDGASLRSLDDDHPLGVLDDEIRVRWRPGASLDGAPTLAEYLAERIDLLIDRKGA